MRNLIFAAIVVAFLAFVVFMAYEAITAPLVDENERVIEDPYGRMPKK